MIATTITPTQNSARFEGSTAIIERSRAHWPRRSVRSASRGRRSRFHPTVRREAADKCKSDRMRRSPRRQRYTRSAKTEPVRPSAMALSHPPCAADIDHPRLAANLGGEPAAEHGDETSRKRKERRPQKPARALQPAAP